ncbi:hypothetical protein [Sutcliffiella rhizosphaerae]|uniref:Lipoprotein n=1 Tax=Sutcliffiella rhizosphaerae TaxID=2880967 RepID=A0ABM8YKN5_9BACI|nr:hypothetical protein [Sutcliffiella rhizosphaerae]CAG9620512.1 hypothetical protein BACCIP111883_01281 [Sutcliffiella rhizosphaerae]
MKKHLVTSIIVCSLLLLTACQQEEIINEPAPLDGLFDGMELSYNEYKFILDDVVERGKKMELEDKDLEKWVIRAIGDEKLMNKRDLSEEEAIEKGEYAKQYYEALVEISTTKYSVTISDKELGTWIEEEVEPHEFPQQKAYADALNLTIKELNHEYDRDLYRQTMIYEKIFPLLQDEYDTNDSDVIREEFHKEVENTMK